MPSKEKGQATLELALCLPFLALLLAALVEIGLVVGDQAHLWHAAREAARAAVVDPDPSAARAAAGRTGLDGVTVSIDPEPGQRVLGEPLTVSLTYEPNGRIPLVGELVSRVALRAEATMRIERP
ncbi:MAG: TadE/TadG family type IV pilus assembly protein [Actinomycetota bacterium]